MEQEMEKTVEAAEVEQAPIQRDIKYRGPLSYRGLRIIGWLAFAASQLGSVFAVAPYVGAAKGSTELAQTIFDSLGALMMPLFLLANFALILQARRSIWKVLSFHGALTLGIVILYYGFLGRYSTALFGLIVEKEQVDSVFSQYFQSGMNVFLDLLLCTSFAFFINVEPKQIFTGKKVYFLRALIALPIAYEIAFQVIKFRAAVGEFTIPFWLVPWVPSKSISMFIAFAIISSVLKIGERRAVLDGVTKEELHQYEDTNRNSLRVSIVTSITFLIVGLADLGALFFMTLSYVPELTTREEVWYIASNLYGMGFGQGGVLLIAIPFAMLFSFSRTHKNPAIDRLVPIAGIGLTALVSIEGLYFLITHWS